jgi:hypothetical protein
MFIAGHVGLGLGLLAALRRARGSTWAISLGWVSLFALLPDIIDKPLGLLWWELGSRRLIAHSLLFSLLTLVCVRLLWPRLASYAWLTPVHLLLDGMWWSPHTLLFPFLGLRFDPDPLPPESLLKYARLLLWKLTHQPDMALGEIFGTAVLAIYLWGRRREAAARQRLVPLGRR